MNTISSQNLEQCIEYSYGNKIAASEYASFLRFLVMTMKKDLPVELFDQSNDQVVKGQIKDFSVQYQSGREGEVDALSLNYITVGEEKLQTLILINTGSEKVSKDASSGPRTFYRFYVYAENNEEGYRFTFNRRVTKK